MMQGKHIWTIPLLLALLVGGVGWWADHALRRTIEQEVRIDLQSTLDANVTALEIWMANQKRIAAALTEEPRFRTLAFELFDLTATNEGRAAPVAEAARQMISRERLQERLHTLGFDMAQLVSTNLEIVTDSGRLRTRSGTPVLEELKPRFEELFASGEPILITPFKVRRPSLIPPPEITNRFFRSPRNAQAEPPPRRRGFPARFTNQSVMQVAAPIKDDAKVTRGALALGINPDAEFTRILSVAHSGDSGETIAFDTEGLLISESRFDQELKQLGLLEDKAETVSALRLTLHDPGGDLARGFTPNTNTTPSLMRMVTQAIEGKSGVEVKPFRDYRGVPVVGAWRWLPDYGFGVGTKIDAREAFKTLGVVRGVFAILFTLLVLASLGILLFSYRQALWRRRLTEAELKARQLGQYKLLEKIGEGGMGIVYKAHHALLRRETALKLLPPDKSDSASIELFQREVQLTCRLTHPNTIQVYDYGHTPDGIFYYAMEYLDGLNLHDLVARYGAQPEERVQHILAQVSESLSEAHALGLIHRDIKPANVFLCDRGGVADTVKVLDFGLVKHFAESADAAPTAQFLPADGIIGTPNFLAPEAIRDHLTSDARSDIYALGALGYFLLTGKYVFESESVAEICRKHLEEIPTPPSQRVAKPISPVFEALILQCLEKDPGKRPPTALKLLAALRAIKLPGEWTAENRAAWWASHRATASVTSTTPDSPTPVSLDETVRIEFGDRNSRA